MLPDAVRALRGDLTQEQFAQAIGVTRLTVLRWELPLNHPQSRRPRGKTLHRLLDFSPPHPGAQPAAPPEPPPTPGFPLDFLPDEEGELIRQALTLLEQGRLDACGPLLKEKDAFISPAGRAMARSVLLYLRLFHEESPATARQLSQWLLSALRQGHLPPFARQLAHQALAFHHAWPRLESFSPSKTYYHAHLALRVAQAHGLPLAAHAHAARLQAAFLHQDFFLFHHFFFLARHPLGQTLTPFSRALALEMTARHLDMEGYPDDAQTVYTALNQHAKAHGLRFAQTRALSGLGVSLFFCGGPYAAVAPLMDEGKALLRQGAPMDHGLSVLAGLETRVAFQNLERERFAQLLQASLQRQQKRDWPEPMVNLTRLLSGVIAESLHDLEALATHMKPYAHLENADWETRLLSVALQGWLAMGHGKMIEAEGHWAALVQNGLGRPYILPLARNGEFALFFTLVLRGAIPEAVQAWRRIQQLETWRWGLNMHYFLRAYRGLFLALTGNPAEGEVEVRSSLHHFQQLGDLNYFLLTQRLLALVLDQGGHPAAAKALETSEADMTAHGLKVAVYATGNIRHLGKTLRAKAALPVPAGPAPQKGGGQPPAWMARHLTVAGHSPRTLAAALVSLVEKITHGAQVSFQQLAEDQPPMDWIGHGLHTPHATFDLFTPTGFAGRLQVSLPLTPVEHTAISTLVSVAEGCWPAGAGLQGATPAAWHGNPLDLDNLLARGITPQLQWQGLSLSTAMADSPQPVLLNQTTNAHGLELAVLLHRHSPRKHRPLIVTDGSGSPCALQSSFPMAWPTEMATPPTRETLQAALEAARGGVLFLPEIWRLDANLQHFLTERLARFNHERMISPDTAQHPPKLVAASSEDLFTGAASVLFSQEFFLLFQGFLVEPGK